MSTNKKEYTFTPNEAHVNALTRRRRVVVNYDTIASVPPHLEGEELAESMFGSADLPNSPIDSIWWNWGEGNFAFYKSKILEPCDFHRFNTWVDRGEDMVGILLEKAKKRELESFFSYRINGSDSDHFVNGHHIPQMPKFKKAHPDKLIYTERYHRGWSTPAYNFRFPEVRQHKLAILNEVFTLYDFDGIEIDFARVCPVLHPNPWHLRGELTKFMVDLRRLMQTKAKELKHPILIAVRIPETIAGCHFDGIHIEEWVRRGLVDIMALGCRSFEIDHEGFHKVMAESHYPIKSYPCIDEIHSSDGYHNAAIEVFRGVFQNWKHQGFSGIQTFNFQNADPHVPTVTGDVHKWLTSQWTICKMVYEEIAKGDYAYRNCTYVIQRRAGGHMPRIESYPWDWKTPRAAYCNSNMEAQLPAKLLESDDQDIFLHIYVGEKDPLTDTLVIALSEFTEIVVRVNGCVLTFERHEKKGNLFLQKFDVSSIAEGDNLISVSLRNSQVSHNVWVEFVELS